MAVQLLLVNCDKCGEMYANGVGLDGDDTCENCAADAQ